MTKRQIQIDGAIARIQLTKRYVAIIDAADVPVADGLNWSAKVNPWTVYAQRSIRKPDGRWTTIYLHRILLGDDPRQVDHIDGDGLNNRRSNLRWATHAENQRNSRRAVTNTSGFKGVHWHARDRRWLAQIMLDGRRLHLGYFDCRHAAHRAYCEANARLHGQFGRTA